MLDHFWKLCDDGYMRKSVASDALWVRRDDHQRETAQLQARVAELEEELMQLRAERNSAEMDDEQAAWERRNA